MTSSAPDPHAIPPLKLDDLLQEVHVKIQEIVALRDRSQSLLAAIVAVGSDLELNTVLKHIVEAAVTLVDAEYGALGVVGDDQLSEFITVGIDDQQHARIGDLPSGRGILGLLISDPHALRLTDLSQHHASVGFPEHHPAMHTFLGVPIRIRGHVFGNLYLTEKRGGEAFDAEDERVLVALAAAAGVAIENARLYDDTRRRERWLLASTEVTMALLSGTDTDEALTVVARRAREVAEGCVSAIALVDGRDQLRIQVADGVEGDKIQGLVLPIETSLAGAAFTTGQPMVVEALPVSDPLLEALGGNANQRIVCVPLGSGETLRGVLLVVMPAGSRAFTEQGTQMLAGFAAQAAVGLALAEARADAERVVLFEDRDRIARDLHDLVIQRLFASGMQLESSTRLITSDEAVTRVRAVVDQLDVTIREIRSAIYALQPPTLDNAPGLRGRLLDLTRATGEILGFSPSMTFSGPLDARITGPVADALVAVLNEALSNVSRHASAEHVDITVELVNDSVTLCVSDDGVGISASGRRSGLANLAERARALGGSFTVGPRHPSGTELTWRAPLRD